MTTFSMNVIASTLSQHSEMIAPGVMGINFMKPEKPINTMSEVYKLVQEEEQNKVKSPTICSSPPIFKPKIPPTFPSKPKSAPVVNSPAPPAPASPALLKQTSAAPEGASQGICSDCARTIIGPFVKLNDRILHEDCFKCSTCGSSLKNLGYHNINNKLYCDTHAKLAARVIASTATQPGSSPTSFSSAAPPSPQPVAPPQAVQPPSATPLAPQPPVIPSLPMTNLPQSAPIPYGHNLTNLPHTPSSSGNLAFRSISPQPFKRISGEFHNVAAPSSTSPRSTPTTPSAYSSGPLPFEMKPYMPPDQSQSSIFSFMSDSSKVVEMSQTTQVVQKTTTQMSQKSSQSTCSMDYKQVLGGQSRSIFAPNTNTNINLETKFIWPPPKPLFEADGSLATDPSPASAQNYSPLVTQSNPDNSSFPTYHPVQAPTGSSSETSKAEQPQEDAVSSSTLAMQSFSAQPVKVEEDSVAVETTKESSAMTISSSISSASQASNFTPVLPPIVDLKPTIAPTQPGVPTGAGSKPAPKKGRGQLMHEHVPGRIPICGDCGEPIRGPFIIALNRTWCPDHFHCNNLHCKTQLLDVGFVEEQGQLYCENCYESFLAPICNKCTIRIKGDCLNALDKQWHPECFICAYCKKPFGNNSFYLEDGLPYCEKDWNELFTTKCVGCGFPIEAGDRWVEALNNNYHSQCFKCSVCQKNLEGQSFYAKGGKPYCKQHAR